MVNASGMPITTVAITATAERRQVARRLRRCASKKLSRSRGPIMTGLTASVAMIVWNICSTPCRAGRFPVRKAALMQRHLNVFGFRKHETRAIGPQRSIGQKSARKGFAIVGNQFTLAPFAIQVETWTIVRAEGLVVVHVDVNRFTERVHIVAPGHTATEMKVVAVSFGRAQTSIDGL